MLEYQLGNSETGAAYLQRLLEVMRRTPPGPNGEYAVVASVVPAVAYITGSFDRFDVAKRAAETVLAASGAAPIVTISAREGLALMAVLQREIEAARTQYDAIAGQPEIFMEDTISTSMDRVLGLLAMTIGQPDAAVAHFEDAIKVCCGAGFGPELAWACCDLANTLLQADSNGAQPSRGKQEKALSLLKEGLAVAEELGMRPLVERMQAQHDLVESWSRMDDARVASNYPDELTQREVDVLRLIAAGKSNQQIAEALVISIHTVIYHVRNIFSKTGAANRVEAATYAAQRRLTA